LINSAKSGRAFHISVERRELPQSNCVESQEQSQKQELNHDGHDTCTCARSAAPSAGAEHDGKTRAKNFNRRDTKIAEKSKRALSKSGKRNGKDRQVTKMNGKGEVGKSGRGNPAPTFRILAVDFSYSSFATGYGGATK